MYLSARGVRTRKGPRAAIAGLRHRASVSAHNSRNDASAEERQKQDVHCRFYGISELVGLVLRERIERVAYPTLSNQFQRHTPHPVQDINFLGTAFYLRCERLSKLHETILLI